MRVFFTGSQAFGEGKQAPYFYVPMSKLLAERLESKDYGGGLDQWFVLFIFQRPDGPNGPAPERKLYRRTTGELDLRLLADHEAWRKAGEEERYRLLYDVARRSFDIMRQKKIQDFDIDTFERDVEAIAAEQGWTR